MQNFNTSSSNSTTLNTGNLAPSVVLGLCCLIGVPGNIAVVVMIGSNFKRENFTLKLMLNLAVSDLLSLFTLPVWIYSLLYGWSFGVSLCKLIYYIAYFSICVSILTVTLMSVQRYLAVLHPQYWARLRRTGKRILLGTLWGLASVLASPVGVLGDVYEVGRQQECSRKYRSDVEHVSVLLVEILLQFVIPFCILATSYFCLHKKVNQTALFNNQRMTKLVTSIVVTFFIFWIPLHVVNVLGISVVLLKSETLETFHWYANNIAKSLVFISCCVNPFLYAFASRKLRQDTQHSGGMPGDSTRNA